MLILDQIEFEKFKRTIPSNSFRIFDDQNLNFLQALSKELLRSQAAKQYPDLITFGFFCRKSNLENLKKDYLAELDFRFGYGSAVHIAPSNIPINFAFSFIFGLLSGNSNIVRMPTNQFPQNNFLLEVIIELSNSIEFKQIYDSNIFFSSERNSKKLNEIINYSDSLVVWGGDNTAIHFKSLKKKINCNEIYFPNRVSSLLLHCKEFIAYENKMEVVRNFYNDTFLVDQNACSSPTNIFWFGSKKEANQAQTIFWETLQDFLNNEKYELETGAIIDKHLAAMHSIKKNERDIRIEKISNEIWSTSDQTFSPDNFRLGLYNSISISSLSSLKTLKRENEQSLTYFGFSITDLQNEFIENEIFFDRVIPIGQALDMGIIWDGKDIIRHLSKSISFK